MWRRRQQKKERMDNEGVVYAEHMDLVSHFFNVLGELAVISQEPRGGSLKSGRMR